MLVGPIKGMFGYTLLKVTTIKKASQQSQAQAKENIRNLLRGQKEQTALNKFIKDFRDEYKNKTNCADDFRVAECKNAPKEKTNTTPASGGAPQQGGAPQTGAPQTGAPPTSGAPTPTPAPQSPSSP